MDSIHRTLILRNRCLEHKKRPNKWNWPYVIDAESFKKSESLSSWQLRSGILCLDRLSNCHFELDEYELLIGRPCIMQFSKKRSVAAMEYLKKYPRPLPWAQDGHCEINISDVFRHGPGWIKEKIRKENKETLPQSERDTLESFLTALDGLSIMISNACEDVEKLVLSETSSERREELNKIISSCRQISDGAPRSFQEALQLLWFIELGIMHGDQVGLILPGHLDRILLSFYENDIANKIIDNEKTILLLESFYILINEYVPSGLAMSVMIGGRDADGQDVTNELSYLCLEALRRTNLEYPTVGISYNSDTPDKLTDLAVELISKGYTTPAFFGDDVIQKGLKKYGVPADEACLYINSACVEITPSGSSNIWVASPYFSTCKILVEEIAAELEENSEAEDFEAFLNKYLKRLASHIEKEAAILNEHREKRRLYGGKPLQSVFTLDCIARHRDIDNAGGRYNWVENSFVGIGNLADSLYVMKEEVFERKTISMKELKEILDSDFNNNESARLRFLNSYPKYGNNCGDVDSIVSRIARFITDECAKYKILPDESPFVPGTFCWIMHEVLGKECGATPDGRHAGIPFADGGGPAQGREKNGPTAAILSTTSWDHSNMIGGLAFNMKFNKSIFKNEDSVKALKNLILTYLKRGGFEVQINVLDHAELLAAKADPESYRGLVVRIGGYTDYFTRMHPEMQDELISRTAYSSI